MRIATFNVNSVRARAARLSAFLERKRPDVVCLQEIKVVESDFPRNELHQLGYEAALIGQKSYNGVAILSRAPISDVRIGIGDTELDAQARLIAGTVGGVRILSAYFPNGGELGSDKWSFKLRFMAALLPYLREEMSRHRELALCGDFNVAPHDDDVARPAEWAGTVLTHPEVRDALDRIAALGLHDAFRPFHPEGGVYSWWDYRGMGFERGNGLRIDHVFVTEALRGRVVGAMVDRAERAGEGASDHAPVLVEWE